MTQAVEPGSPPPEEVNKFHANSDKDSSTTAHHHSLGLDPNKASPGHHTHDGRNSKKIGIGLDPSFPVDANATYSEAQMQRIIDALRDLGFGES